MCTEEKDLKPRSAEQVRESSELGAGLKAKSFSPQIRKVSFMLTFFILPTRCETNFKFDTTTRAKTELPKHCGLKEAHSAERSSVIGSFIFFIFLKFVEQNLKQNKHFVCMYQ